MDYFKVRYITNSYITILCLEMLERAKAEPRTASAVTHSTLKVTSLLLDPNIANQWQALNMQLQVSTSNPKHKQTVSSKQR